MTFEELDREILTDEERLVSSLNQYKNAKAEYRKARITSITNKLLLPYRRYKISVSIAKYDAMIEKIEKQKEKQLKKAEKLQSKEQERIRKQDKKDFKTAIRAKQKEDIINFFDEKKSDVINYGNDMKEEVRDTFSYIKYMGKGKVSKASSFVNNVRNFAIKKVKENTTIDLTIKNAIEDVKLKYATSKYNSVLDKKTKEELKKQDIPFSNMKEKIQRAKKQSSYMGKATNRVVRYFKSKKDNLLSTAHEKALETEFNMRVSAYEVMGKVSKTMSEIRVVFNNELDDLKANINNRYTSIKRDIKSGVDNISLSIEEAKENNKEKRAQKEQDIAIKTAQLKSMKEALQEMQNSEDIFANSPSLDTGISISKS